MRTLSAGLLPSSLQGDHTRQRTTVGSENPVLHVGPPGVGRPTTLRTVNEVKHLSGICLHFWYLDSLFCVVLPVFLLDLSAFVLMFIVYFGCESIDYVYWKALLCALTFILDQFLGELEL